ncbi:MAG TPA: hypothetical protein VGO11_25180 [Chthoniobacteraceae bacterium]|jgi:hypothetical protein|nr:hypothetical protein [Chthoniobacteraceae bacterium]
MKFAAVVSLVISGMLAAACATTASDRERHWRKAAREIKVGMSESQVLEILTANGLDRSLNSHGWSGGLSGGHYGLTYRLDREFVVSVGYEEALGASRHPGISSDRVDGPATLARQPLPRRGD